MSLLDYTILMPCLNEVQTLPFCIKSAKAAITKLTALGLTGEILISNHISTDGSKELALEEGCRVVDCPTRGYGGAVNFGSNHAYGKIIVIGDSDASYDFEEAIPMIQLMLSGYEFCMGTRIKGKILPGAMPFKNRWIGVPGLTALLNICFQTGFSDAHCGLRGYHKASFLRMNLKANGMEQASEMLIRAKQLRLKSIEIPITLHPDLRNRSPHLNPWRDGLRHVALILGYFIKKWR